MSENNEISSNQDSGDKDETAKRIDSLALAFTFISLGVILAFTPDFFGNELAATASQWVFIILGMIGFFCSFGDKNSQIKGMSDIGAGILLLAVGIACYLFIPKPIGSLIGLVFLLFGIYGAIRGLLLLFTTSWMLFKVNQKNSTRHEAPFLIIVEGATKIIALAMVIIQMVRLLA